MNARHNHPSDDAEPNGYELYLMRHGPAGQRGSLGIQADDGLRALTDVGRKKMLRVAHGLRKLPVRLDWVVTSPLVRAKETAEIVAKVLAPEAPLTECEALASGGSTQALLSFLAEHAERSRVLLVGHEPDLSLLAGHLMGAGPKANLGLRKGGCCLIHLQEIPPRSAGELVWWATPRLLRKLA